MEVPNKLKKISTAALVMIILSNVLSPMGMVVMDQYGESAIFYYLLVVVTFLIPSAFIFSELGAAFPESGGLYNWTKKAFGQKVGNIALWSQWLGLILSCPVILSFTTSVLVYPIAPRLVADGTTILIGSMLLLFFAWIISNISVKFSAVIGYLAALLAVLIPVGLIIVLAIIWLGLGHPSSTPFHMSHILPSFKHMATFSLIGATVFMFSGMEIAGNYQPYTRSPHIQYPRAVIISTMIIALVSIFGTLAIEVLVPKGHINLTTGLIQAFVSGAKVLDLPWLPFMISMLFGVGIVGVVSLFFISLSKGIQASVGDGLLPVYFAKENARGIPTRIVLAMTLITVAVTLLFLFLPTVGAAYWIIEAVVVIGASVRYLLVFPAALVLRYKYKHIRRPIKVPGGNIGMWICVGFAFFMTAFSDLMTFVPPDQFKVGNHWVFELLLLLGTGVFIVLPLLSGWYCRRHQS